MAEALEVLLVDSDNKSMVVENLSESSNIPEAENGEQENNLETSGSANDNSNASYSENGEGAINVHRCDKCEYETFSRAALSSHIALCQGNIENDSNNRYGKKFKCDVCNMQFSNGANMRRHKMRHTGVKPFECRVCQKRFFRKDHLAEHSTTHSKNLPFHCPICQRGFQRQIAMRAHFQNEHVGQNDIIKTCPLCSYRAESMKSLRLHVFKSHGIDLDNPGPNMGGRSILNDSERDALMAVAGYNDSCDSNGARSIENTTPPMHFLTPHVEISMADGPPPAYSPNQMQDPNMTQNDVFHLLNGNRMISESNGTEIPNSPQSGDSAGNLSNGNVSSNGIRSENDVSPITPSVSLIPIKQEPLDEDKINDPVNLSTPRNGQSGASSISVSPLKSLLKDDLKRRFKKIYDVPLGRLRPDNMNIEPSGSLSEWNYSPAGRRFSLSLQCVFCGIGFPNQTLYFLHKGCHSDTNPWKCNICGDVCANVYDFNSHLLSKNHQ